MSAIGNKVALQTPVPTSVCFYVQSGSGGVVQGAQRPAQPLTRVGMLDGWAFSGYLLLVQGSPLS